MVQVRNMPFHRLSFGRKPSRVRVEGEYHWQLIFVCKTCFKLGQIKHFSKYLANVI